MPGGEAAAGFRGSRLHVDRPSLWAARHVQWPRDLVVRAGVVQHAQAVDTGVLAAGSVVAHGVVRPTVPQPAHHAHILFRPFIAFGVAEGALVAVVAGGGCQPCGDDVPADSPVGYVVDRGELPSEIEGFGVGGGTGGDEADMGGRAGQCGEGGDWLQPGARGVRDVLAYGQGVGQEDRIEQAGFSLARDVGEVADIGQRQW